MHSKAVPKHLDFKGNEEADVLDGRDQVLRRNRSADSRSSYVQIKETTTAMKRLQYTELVRIRCFSQILSMLDK